MSGYAALDDGTRSAPDDGRARFYRCQVPPAGFDLGALHGAVVLVRDPRDAVHSLYQFLGKMAGRMAGAPEAPSFPEFLDGPGFNGTAPVRASKSRAGSPAASKSTQTDASAPSSARSDAAANATRIASGQDGAAASARTGARGTGSVDSTVGAQERAKRGARWGGLAGVGGYIGPASGGAGKYPVAG